MSIAEIADILEVSEQDIAEMIKPQIEMEKK